MIMMMMVMVMEMMKSEIKFLSFSTNTGIFGTNTGGREDGSRLPNSFFQLKLSYSEVLKTKTNE